MATDIAFAIGVLALVAPGIPAALRVFLLTLAIVDDIGAILVIAVFYSDGIQLEWLEHVLHPWSSLLIVPVFALANAGVRLSGDAVSEAVSSPVAWGVVIGLVVGKTVGISGAAWLASRTRIAELPEGAGIGQVVGVAALGGIGFTVSLFITALAFDDPAVEAEAKIGILAASVLATLLGAVLLRRRAL